MTRPRPGRALLAGATMTCLLATAGCAAAPRHASAPAGPVPAPTTAPAPTAETLTILLQQQLPNVEGKTFTSALITFPPGGRAGPHKHGNAFVYAFVLNGTFRSRLAGEDPRIYRQGENWTEPPGAHHLLTENTSRTQPARLLVVFVTDTGAPLPTDDPPG